MTADGLPPKGDLSSLSNGSSVKRFPSPFFLPPYSVLLVIFYIVEFAGSLFLQANA